MSTIGIIGGTGLTQFTSLNITSREVIHTPYGEPSGFFTRGVLFDKDVVFLARHGYSHHISPHEINYRANLWAFNEIGVKHLLAFGSVGGISAAMKPESIVIPDQIIDYTHSRQQTFFEGPDNVKHVDFTRPYSNRLRQAFIDAGKKTGISIIESAVYGATQGPRLETAAEINRLERDGCDIVGMTAMPEAVLARELGIDYVTCALISNYAAGRGGPDITPGVIRKTLDKTIEDAARLMEAALQVI